MLESYYWWFQVRFRLVERWLKVSDSRQPDLLLDWGCGTGGFLEYLLRSGQFSAGQLLGMEPSVQACAALKCKGLPHLPLRHELPLAQQLTQSPDVITMLDVLEHLEDPVSTLRQLHQVAAPGARLVILVPAFMSLWSDWDSLLGHQRRYTVQSLLKQLSLSGWLPRQAQYIFGSMFFPALLRTRLLNQERLSKTEFPRVSPPINRFLTFWYILESRLSVLPIGTSVAALAIRNDGPYLSVK